MQIIPVQAVPNQQLTTQLNGQDAQIFLHQEKYGVFVDLYVNNALIVAGVIGQNLNKVVRDAYLGFVGDLGWWDSQGTTDPVYTGIDTRYFLFYLEAADLAAAGFSG